MKKLGAIIENWQTHTLSEKEEVIAMARGMHENFNMDKVMVFTGTVVFDHQKRWEPGFHMRSSLIVNLDPETGICETANTIYTLQGEEGGDIFNDMGPAVMSIFY